MGRRRHRPRHLGLVRAERGGAARGWGQHPAVRRRLRRHRPGHGLGTRQAVRLRLGRTSDRGRRLRVRLPRGGPRRRRHRAPGSSRAASSTGAGRASTTASTAAGTSSSTTCAPTWTLRRPARAERADDGLHPGPGRGDLAGTAHRTRAGRAPRGGRDGDVATRGTRTDHRRRRRASPEFLGVRSAHGLHRIGAEGDAGCGVSAHHYFYGEPVDEEAITAAWQSWLAALFPPAVDTGAL